MAATNSTRWFFSDWLSDPGIRASSVMARGLWIDLLCIMGANQGKNYGYLKINKSDPTTEALARIVNMPHGLLVGMLEELEKNGVFSRTRTGVIYCRRMARAQKSRENGKLGGNPNLQTPTKVPEESSASKVNGFHSPVNLPYPPYPLPLPSRIESKKEATGKGRGKPRHGIKTKDGRRIWFDRDTDEFKAYAKDYSDKHKASVVMSWNNSGAWFNYAGER